MGGELIRNPLLVFDLGPVPLIFTMVLNIPTVLLRRINVKMISFLDHIAQTLKQILQGRKTKISLKPNLGFAINEKKCQP